MGRGTILWDFDGTLGWREGGWSGLLLSLLRARGWAKDVGTDEIRAQLTQGFRWHAPQREYRALGEAEEWWDELYPLFEDIAVFFGASPEGGQELARVFRERFLALEDWRIFPDVVPCLTELSKRGWTQEVASNNFPELENVVAGLGIRPFFGKIHTSAWIGFEKPHPGFYSKVLSGIPGRSQVWMVGDSLEADYFGAIGAGISALLVRKHASEPAAFLPDLIMLPDFIDRSLSPGSSRKNSKAGV